MEDFHIMACLIYLAHQIRVDFENQFKEYGCNWPQCLAMGFIKYCNENNINVSQKDIAKSLGIKGSSVTSLVNTMEKKELLVRKKNADDERSYNLFLTEKGRTLTKNLGTAVEELDNKFKSQYTEAQLEELTALLKIATGDIDFTKRNINNIN